MIELVETKIDIGSYLKQMDDPAHGACLVFSGVVRNRNHGRTVTSVSYDAFAPLCTQTFSEISDEARRHCPGARILLIHRVGRLEVGEVSVLLAVSTPHRAEAYQISRYVIENLKTRAPIWKKETYVDGESEWLQGHALCSHSNDGDLPYDVA